MGTGKEAESIWWWNQVPQFLHLTWQKLPQNNVCHVSWASSDVPFPHACVQGEVPARCCPCNVSLKLWNWSIFYLSAWGYAQTGEHWIANMLLFEVGDKRNHHILDLFRRKTTGQCLGYQTWIRDRCSFPLSSTDALSMWEKIKPKFRFLNA